MVLDALESEAIARAQREAIANLIKQPVRVLVSSPHHNPYSKGNIAFHDVWKIGHENYRTDLLALMEREKISAEEQRARLPNQTYRDRLTLHFGGKEIQVLYLGSAHTRGDSVIFVPQDRIAYPSQPCSRTSFQPRARASRFDGSGRWRRWTRSTPISSCRPMARFRMIPGRHARSCADSGKYLPTPATLSRRRSRAARQKIRRPPPCCCPSTTTSGDEGTAGGPAAPDYKELTAKRP